MKEDWAYLYCVLGKTNEGHFQKPITLLLSFDLIQSSKREVCSLWRGAKQPTTWSSGLSTVLIKIQGRSKEFLERKY